MPLRITRSHGSIACMPAHLTCASMQCPCSSSIIRALGVCRLPPDMPGLKEGHTAPALAMVLEYMEVCVRSCMQLHVLPCDAALDNCWMPGCQAVRNHML